MRVVIERPCAMPLVVETNEGLSREKYPVKVSLAGETEYLTLQEAHDLFRGLFKVLDEIDDRTDREEIKKSEL